MEFLYFLAELRTPWLDAFFMAITSLGEQVVVIAVICLMLWCVNKEIAYRITLSYFVSGLIGMGLKITTRVERPWIRDPDFLPVLSSLEMAGGYSFPSAHTQSAVSLYATLALNTKAIPLKIILLIPALLVGMSRMYLGVHTPVDVITAFVMTLVICTIVTLLSKKYGDSKTAAFLISCFTALLATAAIIYTVVLIHRNVIAAEEFDDIYMVACGAVGFAVSYFVDKRYFGIKITGSIKARALKFLCGIVSTAAIIAVVKLTDIGIYVEGIAFGVVIFWAMILYPLICDRVTARIERKPTK